MKSHYLSNYDSIFIRINWNVWTHDYFMAGEKENLKLLNPKWC
jgi:hypothetical protein